MLQIKFKYKGKVYPQILVQSEDYRKEVIIYPNSWGDYDMATVDSGGAFELLEEIPCSEIEVLESF
jgi:hypothetical protein